MFVCSLSSRSFLMFLLKWLRRLRVKLTSTHGSNLIYLTGQGQIPGETYARWPVTLDQRWPDLQTEALLWQKQLCFELLHQECHIFTCRVMYAIQTLFFPCGLNILCVSVSMSIHVIVYTCAFLSEPPEGSSTTVYFFSISLQRSISKI